MRVESIIDYKYRVQVPEKLVMYTVGASKKTRDGAKNTLRKAQNSRDEEKPKRAKKNFRTGKTFVEASHGNTKKVQRRKDRKKEKIDLTQWNWWNNMLLCI